MRLTSLVLWLSISVVVNAVLAGVVVGGAIAHSRSVATMWPEHQRTQADRSHWRHRKALSKRTRRGLRRDLARAWRQADQERTDLDQARERVHEIVSTDPLDQSALKTALDDLYQARSSLAARTRDVIVSRFAELPAHEREGLLRMIENLPYRSSRPDCIGAQGSRRD